MGCCNSTSRKSSEVYDPSESHGNNVTGSASTTSTAPGANETTALLNARASEVGVVPADSVSVAISASVPISGTAPAVSTTTTTVVAEQFSTSYLQTLLVARDLQAQQGPLQKTNTTSSVLDAMPSFNTSRPSLVTASASSSGSAPKTTGITSPFSSAPQFHIGGAAAAAPTTSTSGNPFLVTASASSAECPPPPVRPRSSSVEGRPKNPNGGAPSTSSLAQRQSMPIPSSSATIPTSATTPPAISSGVSGSNGSPNLSGNPSAQFASNGKPPLSASGVARRTVGSVRSIGSQGLQGIRPADILSQDRIQFFVKLIMLLKDNSAKLRGGLSAEENVVLKKKCGLLVGVIDAVCGGVSQTNGLKNAFDQNGRLRLTHDAITLYLLSLDPRKELLDLQQAIQDKVPEIEPRLDPHGWPLPIAEILDKNSSFEEVELEDLNFARFSARWICKVFKAEIQPNMTRTEQNNSERDFVEKYSAVDEKLTKEVKGRDNLVLRASN